MTALLVMEEIRRWVRTAWPPCRSCGLPVEEQDFRPGAGQTQRRRIDAFNLVDGVLGAERESSSSFHDIDITGMAPYHVARAGLARRISSCSRSWA